MFFDYMNADMEEIAQRQVQWLFEEQVFAHESKWYAILKSGDQTKGRTVL